MKTQLQRDLRLSIPLNHGSNLYLSSSMTTIVRMLSHCALSSSSQTVPCRSWISKDPSRRTLWSVPSHAVLGASLVFANGIAIGCRADQQIGLMLLRPSNADVVTYTRVSPNISLHRHD